MPLGLRLFHRQWLWNVVFIQCHSDRDFLINRPISVIELFDRILNDKRLFLFYCGLTVAKWSIAQPSSSWFLVSRQTGQHLSTFNCLDRCILGNRIIHRYNFACFFLTFLLGNRFVTRWVTHLLRLRLWWMGLFRNVHNSQLIINYLFKQTLLPP